MNLRAFEELAEGWRLEAATLEGWGASGQAGVLVRAADELQERLQEWKLELLTITEAAEELGLAYDTVQRKLASGELVNVGEQGAPRVRRCDVYGDAGPRPEPVNASETLLGIN